MGVHLIYMAVGSIHNYSEGGLLPPHISPIQKYNSRLARRGTEADMQIGDEYSGPLQSMLYYDSLGILFLGQRGPLSAGEERLAQPPIPPS